MIKTITFAKFATVLLCFVYFSSGCVSAPQRHGLVFLIPDGYVGWIRLKSNVKGTKPLPVKNGSYIVNIPPTGLLKTSTPEEDGWGVDTFYYVAKNGKKTRIPTAEKGAMSMVWGGAGTTNESYMFIGTKQQFNNVGIVRPGQDPGPLKIPKYNISGQ